MHDGSKSLPFELRRHEIVVPVAVSGMPGFRFLLDTGASRSVISSRVAEKVGAVPSSRTLMMTPSGQSMRAATAVSLQVGDRLPVHVTATIVAEEPLTSAAQADGIIGQDVLSSVAYTIDYSRRTIQWDAIISSAVEHRVPLEFADGRAVVTVFVEGGRAPLRMIPDTGADGLVLFARRSSRLPPLTPLNVGLLRTLAGQRLVRQVLLEGLTVGPVRLREQLAVVLSDTGAGLWHGDGLLPLHLFSRVTVNGPAGYIAVEK